MRRTQRAEQRPRFVAPVVTVVRSIFSVYFPFAHRLCRIPLINLSLPPACPQRLHCGERLLPAQLLIGDGHCQECREFEPHLGLAVSAGEYAGALRGLIHLRTYDSVRPAAPVLGAHLADAIGQLQPTGDDTPLPVPLPLHTSKRSEPGFKQVEVIVRAALKHLPQPLEVAAVRKRRHPMHSQFGLTREGRIAKRRGAFSVTDSERVQVPTVIVIDDVMTTGNTISECVRVLKKAGAKRVWAATVTRTLKGAVSPEIAESEPREVVETADVAVSV